MQTTNRIGLFRGDGFQDFCSVLLSAHLPEFQAVDGRGGDLGNDGFTVRGDALFQAYAPDTRTLAKVRDKVDDSISKAVSLRGNGFPSVHRFVFLTPFDLTVEQHAHLRTAATTAGLESESWGEAKLLAVLAEHPGVKSEFPEILLPDLLDEIRKLRVERVAPTPEPDDDLELTPVEFPWIDVLQKNEPDRPDSTCAAYSYFKLHIASPGLILPSIEPSDEDVFLHAVHERFPEDSAARLETRNHERVLVEYGLPELRFHRRWGRWTTGVVTMAATLSDLNRPGLYSIADMAIDVTRALRLAAFLGGPGRARVRLGYDPNQLEVKFDPSDVRARERLAAKMDGIHLVERPVLKQTFREVTLEGEYDMSSLAADAHVVAADLIVPAVRCFHWARIDTKAFGASIPKLIATSLDALVL